MGSHRKLGFETSHRVAMLRNMTSSLILNGQIVTTVTRAKELRRVAERTITLGKKRRPTCKTSSSSLFIRQRSCK